MRFSILTTVIFFATIITFAGSHYCQASVPGDNDKIAFEKGNWSTITELAKKEGKLIFLDAYASWCGPCKWMAKNVFTDKKVADYYNKNFINAKIDMEVGEGVDIARKYGISAYPTLIYIDHEGNMVHRVCGSRQSDEFIKVGKDALTEGVRLSDKVNSFDATAASAGSMNDMLTDFRDACLNNNEIVNDYFRNKSKSEVLKKDNWKIVHKYVRDPLSHGMRTVIMNYDEFASAYTAETVDGKIFDSYAYTYRASARNKDEEYLAKLNSSIGDLDNKNQEKIALYIKMQDASRNESWEEYGGLAVKYLDSYPTSDANTLNRYAWTFYEHVDNPQHLQMAIKWIEISTTIDPGYANYDTAAALYYKTGNRDKAESYAIMAIDKAKENDQDYSETEKLLELIRGMN